EQAIFRTKKHITSALGNFISTHKTLTQTLTTSNNPYFSDVRGLKRPVLHAESTRNIFRCFSESTENWTD
ncbi:unnamed protein product, partial [Callosobruchus maculatus]